MTVAHIEFLVEEPSMEAALRLLLPKMLPTTSFEVYSHQCKAELLGALPSRLRAYKQWLPDDWRIVVILDRDRDDCTALKKRLEKLAGEAGLVTRSRAKANKFALVNRLAIEELEAWYFGDWEAVREAYPRVPEGVPTKAKFRDPDDIAGGTWEALERVLKKAGYFPSGLRKIELARNVAERMVPNRNGSRSFQVLRDTLVEMAR